MVDVLVCDVHGHETVLPVSCRAYIIWEVQLDGERITAFSKEGLIEEVALYCRFTQRE